MPFQLILSFKSFEPKLINNALKNVQILAHKLQNGKFFLDLGHNLVPAPPHKITGFIFIIVLYISVAFFFF